MILEQAWLMALLGGLLIGLSACLLMAGIGSIAGISGIVGRLLASASNSWQLWFLLGMFGTGLVVHWLVMPIVIEQSTSLSWLVVAGLLVGFGTRLGNGCTSGHGVCGMSRLSKRSIIATLTFMATAITTLALFKAFV